MINTERVCWPGWETVGLIGRGSFGAVYEIQRDVLGEVEKAALKVISIPQSTNDIEELQNDGYNDESITATFKEHLRSIVAEYTLMRKMNDCINIVKCDDVRYVQQDNGIGWDIFIKMELLTPLTKALPESIPESMVIKLAKDMCSALVECKKHNVIHRDIKPQNIFVSGNGDYKLGDFGIAKTVERTSSGTKIGTYKYMAPEVYNNQPYGSAADIYSLGLVLFWMLNDRRMPFLTASSKTITIGMEDEARMRRFSGETIPSPAHGSLALKSIILKACAFNPADRYTSPNEMLQALENLSRGQVTKNVADDLDVRTAISITATEALGGCTKTIILDSVGKINLKIPKGTQNGTVLRLVGLGKDDPNSALTGDAYITIRYAEGKSSNHDAVTDIPKGSSVCKHAGVITSRLARTGGRKEIAFANGSKKTVQIPAGCQNGQIVNGVKIYVHDFSVGVKNMQDLPDAVLEMYATTSSGIGRGIVIAFIAWMIFGMTTMWIPVMAIGLVSHIVFVFVSSIKKKQIIDEAARILKIRQKQNV